MTKAIAYFMHKEKKELILNENRHLLHVLEGISFFSVKEYFDVISKKTSSFKNKLNFKKCSGFNNFFELFCLNEIENYFIIFEDSEIKLDSILDELLKIPKYKKSFDILENDYFATCGERRFRMDILKSIFKHLLSLELFEI